MIHLETVTPENWRLGLSVRDDQRSFVSDSAGILRQPGCPEEKVKAIEDAMRHFQMI